MTGHPQGFSRRSLSRQVHLGHDLLPNKGKFALGARWSRTHWKGGSPAAQLLRRPQSSNHVQPYCYRPVASATPGFSARPCLPSLAVLSSVCSQGGCDPLQGTLVLAQTWTTTERHVMPDHTVAAMFGRTRGLRTEGRILWKGKYAVIRAIASMYRPHRCLLHGIHWLPTGQSEYTEIRIAQVDGRGWHARPLCAFYFFIC